MDTKSRSPAMGKRSISDSIRLSAGTSIPQIGFGVYKSPPEQTKESCLTAFKAGYRHVDTAQFYANGSAVGEAVKASGVPRDQLFITTKIIPSKDESDHYPTVCNIVKETGLAFVDCFLIHTPSAGRETRERAWKALEKLQKEGLAKSIGVSNYGVEHLKQMDKYATIKPVLNQIELHPLMQQEDIVEYCQQHDIAIEAYCPIARGKYLDDATLKKIADAHSTSTAQVLIRWSLQKGYIPLPKSDREARIRSNADVYGFELSDSDIKTIDELGKGKRESCAPDNTRCA